MEAKYQYKFESFGVKIGIASNSERFLKKIVGNLKNVIPDGYFSETEAETSHSFYVETGVGEDKDLFYLSKNGEQIGEAKVKENLWNSLFSLLRMTVAEFAVGKVFLHAGVVGWKEKAIVIPGNSYSGKTTLVAELIKNGAVYFSDEYAVLDEKGQAHPFPKTLSVRGVIDEHTQVELAAETFGGEIAGKPLPVGMVLLLEYEKGSRWNPQILSDGNGVMEILLHTIPIRFNPKFSLQVLNKVANRAIIAKSKRGDAKDVINLLLKFFETEAI